MIRSHVFLCLRADHIVTPTCGVSLWCLASTFPRFHAERNFRNAYIIRQFISLRHFLHPSIFEGYCKREVRCTCKNRRKGNGFMTHTHCHDTHTLFAQLSLNRCLLHHSYNSSSFLQLKRSRRLLVFV